jgi:hypothetical protein
MPGLHLLRLNNSVIYSDYTLKFPAPQIVFSALTFAHFSMGDLLDFVNEIVENSKLVKI